MALRDKAIVALCLQCGLRTVEVERANVEYLAARGEVDKNNLTSKGKEPPLFASTARNSSKGKRLSAQSVGKMIKARMKSIGIDSKRISAHNTRHYAAMQAIKAGVDLREVSAMLCHSSINVTMTYLHDISFESQRAELAA